MDKDKNINESILETVDTEFSTNYNLVLEVYFNFAYYLCCVPYRFKVDPGNNEDKKRKKVYIIHTWWIQRILCYISTIIYVVLNSHRIIDHFINRQTHQRLTSKEVDHYAFFEPDNSIEVDTKKNNNPILHLNIIEALAYFKSILELAYTQVFKKEQILAYLNKIHRYSEKHCSKTTKLHQVYTKHVVILVAVIITLTSLLNYAISSRDNITCKFRNLKSISYFIIHSVQGLRDMDMEMFLITGILPLWFISWDIKNNAMMAMKFPGILPEDNILPECFHSIMDLQTTKLYREVSRLSRAFSRAYGYSLFCYFLHGILWYSVNLDIIFQPAATFNEKLYQIEFICTLLVICGLGASFAYQMSSLKRLTDLDKISARLDNRVRVLMTHLYSTDFSAIRAKVFSVTFATLGHFITQIMVIFLICVQCKLSTVA